MSLIVAHRGASHDAPENTRAAFDLAWRQGADGIEADFHLTREGEIVCIHDATTGRTADRDLVIVDASLVELRQLDFAGQSIMTFAGVLGALPPDKQLFAEIKSKPLTIAPLARVLTAYPRCQSRITLMAFDAEVIIAARRALPSLKTSWLLAPRRDEATGMYAPSLPDIIATLRRIDAHGLSVYGIVELVDRAFVESLHNAGFGVHVWTVDDPRDARRFLSAGVDTVITNRPGALRGDHP